MADPANLSSYRVEQPKQDSEFDQLSAVLSDAFNYPADNFPRFRERVRDENFRVVAEGDCVVGGLAIVPMGQWFGGQSVPTGGISAVGVHPAWRSRGAASELMRQTIRDLHAQNAPLSTLYPATQPVYRRAGYEQAGGLYLCELDLARIDVRDKDLDVRPIDSESESDREIVENAYREFARHHNGTLERGEYIWSRIRNHKGTPANGYFFFDPTASDEAIEGYVFYVRQESTVLNYDLYVTDAVAITPRAGRRLFRFLADHRSMATKMIWQAPPFHPIFNLLVEQSYRIRLKHHWMLRLVDVAGALEARGYGVGVSGELHLDVFGDTVLPDVNNARFVLQVENGRPTSVERSAGTGALRIHINGLAALYSGHLSALDLRRTDLAEGNDETLALASSIFAAGCTPPWMSDMF